MSDEKRKRALALQLQLTLSAGLDQPERMGMRERVEAAKAGTLQADPETLDRASALSQRAEDQMTLSQMGGAAGGLVAKGVQGVPIIGEFVDEAFNAINPGQGDRLRALQSATEREYPKSSLAAEIGGGIVGSLPAAIAGTGAAMQAATRTGRVLRGAAIGAGAGATEGAIAGAGRANDGDRVGGATTGAVVGGTLGGVLGATAPLIGEGVASLAKRIKRLDVKTIADEFGVSAPAARTIKNALLNDDLDTAVSRLRELGDDAFLADAGPATGQLLNSASATGGKALRVTREAVTERSERLGQRLPQKLDDILGAPVGTKQAARQIAQTTAPARKAAFDRAFSQPVDYAGPGIKIEGVLQRVPPNTMQAAIREANEAMAEAGEKNLQILADIADDGSVTFREMPNVRQLHELKMALDGVARDAVDQFGRPNAQGLRAGRLARDLRSAIGDAVPDYLKALKIGGDKIQTDNALDLGRKLLFKGTKVEDVRDFVKQGLSKESRDAARQGIRAAIEDTLSNVRRTISDPDIDAREAMQAVKEMSSRANKDKLKLILGDTKAKQLLDELDRSAAALALRDAVSRNSDTAIRQSIQGQVKAEATPSLLRRTLGRGGNPLEAAQTITEEIAGIDPRAMSGREKAIFDEIADALTRVRGPEAERALDLVRVALAGQPIKDTEAQLIGRVVAGVGAGSVGQGGLQSLERLQTR